jgi:DNA-directed RNA polymerase subunit RPC12/RpoP
MSGTDKGIRYEEAPAGKVPRCPHCGQKLHTIWIHKRGLGIIQQQQIIMCPSCEAMLGYGSFTR